jgi:hypothetical protein
LFKRAIFLILGSLVITLLFTSVAMAGWTPADIYNDYAQNGKLTRDYTDEELHAYLNDAMTDIYPNQAIKDRLDDAVMDLLDRDVFPFTGFQLMIAGIVVVVLIGGGVALRLLTRTPRSSEKS